MSFHKRFYNWDRIKSYLEREDFRGFDNWLVKPDAHILQDQESSDFFKAYFAIPESSRETLFEALRSEDQEFGIGLIKCINVIFDEKNNESHEGTISIYRDLFMAKWDFLAEKYKSLITK